jgi:hypothetical protein
MRFHENPSTAESFHADGRRGSHDEANIRSSQFCQQPKKRKVWPFRSMQAYVKVEAELHSLTSALYRDCSERLLAPAENRTSSRTSSP